MQNLFKEYEQNIKNFIELCQNKTIVFDFDGTLTKFKYTENRLLPCRHEDFLQYVTDGNSIYHKLSIQKTMQYIISQLPKDDVWVLTSSVLPIRKTKTDIITQHLNISENKILHSDNDMHKITILKQLHDQENKPIIFVEDTVYTLIAAEDDLDFVYGYHISSLLP